ncbi:uncharacterized protein [Zea mays]|uniref:uncharacterized protein isoform X2 n=1 Tax=Zea mays TaxID=4577 RepID=UPI0004DE98F3|nr:uncharacterized protein LOC103653195 isoform X2 [Zea mays]|eukprot:XP_008678376.1 uncharacterized protein LOC103653195 isoform X2 [Zea mays]
MAAAHGSRHCCVAPCRLLLVVVLLVVTTGDGAVVADAPTAGSPRTDEVVAALQAEQLLEFRSRSGSEEEAPMTTTAAAAGWPVLNTEQQQAIITGVGGGRRKLVGSRAPTTCTYNECRGCRHRCSVQEVPIDASDPINSAYHYRCVCHL